VVGEAISFPLEGLLEGGLILQVFATVISVRTNLRIRSYLAFLLSGLFLLTLPLQLCAQEEETPLGDVARSLRKKPQSSEAVIDNDNISKLMEDAESHHASGSSMVFSFDSGGKNFKVSSPDVTCSLSFTAKTSSLLTDPLQVDELPRGELAKLEGPATIDGDLLQVAIHNGTAWDLREVMIGLTIIRHPETSVGSYYGPARIVPAVAGSSSPLLQDSSQKQPDVTLLLKVKGSAAPTATAVFRTSLNFALFPDQEWHWAIVKAKGIPPLSSTTDLAMQPGQSTNASSTESSANNPQNLAPTPRSITPSVDASPSNPSAPNSDIVAH
jgi:hypothetical protein